MSRSRGRTSSAGSAWIAAAGAILLAVAPAGAQLRIVNFNVAAMDGDLNAMQQVFAALNADDKPGFAVAPAAYLMQEVQTADGAVPNGPIITRLNAVAPPGVTYARATFTVASGEDSASGAQCCFYRTDLLVEEPAGHADINSTTSRDTDRWRFHLVGYTSPSNTFYLYSSHLKASMGFESERCTEAQAIRSNADALPAGTHILYAGDWNVYVNTECAYQTFIAAGNGQSIDPLGTGPWAGVGNAVKHTQSPCSTGCALVNGGLDDRFDHQHATAAFNDGEGLARIVGANMYRSLGNDGNHYNTDINAGNNSYYPADIPRSNVLADALHVASDHVPVVCEYQLPAVMSAALTPSFGRVILGASVTVQLQVFNDADVSVAIGADELDFIATGSGGLSGVASGSVLALNAPALRNFAVNTAAVGNVSGSVQATTASQGAQNASATLNTAGTVVRHANASLSGDSDVDSDAVELVLARGTGMYALPVSVYNLGFDAFQALLDVDGAGGAVPPFVFEGPPPTPIGGTPGTVGVLFDTDTPAGGIYVATLEIQTSDQDLPGAAGSVLTRTVRVHLRQLLGDIDDDCDVELADLALVLSAFGSCTGQTGYNAGADLDNNGCVELADLAVLLGQFGATCD